MGIAFKCKVSGGLDVTQHFLVKKLIEGFRRSTHEKDTRLPISITLLKQLLAILPAICRDNYEAKMFSAAFTLAFFGFLRVGEITVGSLKKIGHPLFRRDIELIADDKSVRVTIRHSKTDQVGKGTTIITILLGGCYIKYPDIVIGQSALFLPDGVHLSQIGTDIFLNTLSGALRTFITSSDTV